MRFAQTYQILIRLGMLRPPSSLLRPPNTPGGTGSLCGNHLLPDDDSRHGPVADPWIALTAIAGATRRLRPGALVTPLP